MALIRGIPPLRILKINVFLRTEKVLPFSDTYASAAGIEFISIKVKEAAVYNSKIDKVKGHTTLSEIRPCDDAAVLILVGYQVN